MRQTVDRRQIRNYVITQVIYEDANELLYEANCQNTHRKVCLKTYRHDSASLSAGDALEAEAQLLKEFKVFGVPVFIEIISEGGVPFLVFEKPAGSAIASLLRAQPLLTLKQRLEICAGYLDILSRIHKAGWLLLDINLEKILWDETSKSVVILDVMPVLRKAKDGIVAKQVPKGVAYSSPEQTGRSNRRIDERSDIYVAGMVTYQIMTGKFPVDPKDIMRSVHFHMAFNLPKLELSDSSFSEVLDRVVAKMTAKSKDVRYQSVDGALFDFKELIAQFENSMDISTFEIGAKDYSNELVLSQELYGREKELNFLKIQLERAENGRLEVIFIKGQPGIGKSSLIKEFMSQIDLDRYLFVQAKYRKLEQNEHLKGVVMACEQMIRRKSIGLETELSAWLNRVSESIGDNWGLLATLLPGLNGLIARKPVVHNLTPTETRSRLIEALYRFIISSATKENPLILFFDDIQWFDQGSKDIILKLASEENSKHILLLCSYRSDEIVDAHEVDVLIKGLVKADVKFTDIFLSNIENTEIQALIKDSLIPVSGDLTQFVKMIEVKTGGNPFFVKQLLYHIFDEGILRRNDKFAWMWDADAIVALKASSTVIELLEGRISQLAQPVRELLLRVSCFDGWFTRAQLVNWFNYADTFLNESLSTLESENYIYSDKENNFYIFHDRIREAAYGILSDEEKRIIHQIIGEKFLQDYEIEKMQDSLIKAVSHLNKGYRQDFVFERRLALAEANRKVAKHARGVSAFDVALHYASTGFNILTEAERKAQVELSFDLELILAECSFLSGEFKEAHRIFEKLGKIRVSIEQKARMYCVYMDLLQTTNEFKAVMITGRRALALFGIKLPEKVSKISLLWGVLRLQYLFRKIGPENVPNIPRITDHRIFLIQSIYLRVGTAAYFYDRPFFAYSITKILIALVKYGAHPSTAAVGFFFSVILAHRFNRYEYAYKMSVKFEELHARQGGIPNSDRGHFGVAGFLAPYVRPVDEVKMTLERIFLQLKRLGDPIGANFAALYLSVLKFQSGEALGVVMPEAQKYLREIRKTGDLTISDCLMPTLISVARLTGANVDDIFKEIAEDDSAAVFVSRVSSGNVVNAKAWLGTQNLIVDTILRDTHNLPQSVELSAISLEATPFAFNIVYYYLFSALYYYDQIAAGLGDKKVMQKQIAVSRKKLKKWAEVNSLTFDPFWFLFQATAFLAEGDIDKATSAYVDCVETSIKSKNLILNGLANESLGRMFLKLKKDNLGFRCLSSALNCYYQWEAHAKVDQLQNEFPSLIVGRRSDDRRPEVANKSAHGDSLDILSVVKSCQIIGNEIDMSKLLSQIVFLLIENAGAERGHILLKNDDQLILRATSTGANPEDVNIVSKKVDEVETVSISLVKHVARTLETVIIDNAQENEMVRNDMYVKMAGCKSILCMPIVNKGQLIGVIWLENNAATEVFSPKRKEVLEILSTQAAISFENARLFDQEQEKMRMEGELRVAQTVQNTLFEVADGSVAGFKISGSIEAASECGGDWWHYGSFGNLNYLCIGDATGHGVSAALITSAVRSAMASVEFMNDVSAVQIIKLLNNSVAQTSKGQINMTMFLGVYDRSKNEFAYCNASHEPAIHVPWLWIEELRQLSKSDRPKAIKRFYKELSYLSEVTGPSLGSQKAPQFTAVKYELSSRDYIFCYTDGIPEMYALNGSALGERTFINMLAESFFDEVEISGIREVFREKLRDFRTTSPLRDDVTFFLSQKDA